MSKYIWLIFILPNFFMQKDAEAHSELSETPKIEVFVKTGADYYFCQKLNRLFE